MKTRHPWIASLRVALIGAAVLAPSVLFAQGSNANLVGRVIDQSGAALPGATVTATLPTTGLARNSTTGKDGSYSFPSLPPGSYDVKVELAGFKTVIQKKVDLNVASTRTLDVTLQISAVSEMITVTNEAPLARSEPAIGAVISQQELQTLPLNGRQFANVAVLAPGTQLSYNTDPTKPGQLTIQLNGGSGRNVNSVIDGGDNTDDTIGGALQNYPLESVQEFKIQTQEYKAEYGRSTGGVLNVVTKAGTNQFHASAFEYFRDKSLNSETESEKQAGSGKADYTRNQYGASLGGPIVEDKLHFFATAERTDQKTNYIVNTQGVYPSLDGQAVPTPFKDDLIDAKISADISASQFLQVRFGYQKNSQTYGQAPTTTPDALGTVDNKYSSILASYQAQLGPNGLNEFLFQYTNFKNAITSNSTDPTIYFGNGVLSGENPNTPQHTFQKKYQFKDDISYSTQIGSQTHDFKFGVNFIHEPTLDGDFSIGVAAPIYVLSGDTLTSPVSSIEQFGGFSGQHTSVNQYDVYLQDDWRPSPRLTINAGLRYDLNLGFALNESSNPIYQALATQTTYTDASYYKDFKGFDGQLQNDHTNWAPRIGFSYDLTGDNKTFVHGGWGIYYDFPYLNATLLFPTGAVQSNYGVAYLNQDPNGILNPDGSLFQVGEPLPPNQQAPGAFPPNEVADPTVTKTPFSRQLSIGISHQIGDWLGLTLEYSNVAYRDLPFRVRANPLNSDGTARFSQFGNFRLWEGGGRADYNGVNLGFNAKLTDKLRAQGFWTISRATGTVLLGADEFRLTGVDFQPDMGGGNYGGRKDVSVNPLDPNCTSICEGPLYTDARHKVTFAATYTAPWDVNVSGVFRYRSAEPYMIFVDGGSNLGWGLQLPPGVGANAGRGHSFEQLDLSLSKTFYVGGGIGIEGIAQVFNVFNASNPNNYTSNGQPTTYAGDPAQGEQRLLQLGARLTF